MQIREINVDERPLLEEFIYQAIFQKDTNNPIPRSIIKDPTIAIYINDFGQYPDDYCLVANHAGTVAGAVWVRLLNRNPKGFGNIDDVTPEFAISILPQYRKKRFGTKLMESMLEFLKTKGYKKASLAVQKENYAVRMYQQVGFDIIDENLEEYIMVAKLN